MNALDDRGRKKSRKPCATRTFRPSLETGSKFLRSVGTFSLHHNHSVTRDPSGKARDWATMFLRFVGELPNLLHFVLLSQDRSALRLTVSGKPRIAGNCYSPVPVATIPPCNQRTEGLHLCDFACETASGKVAPGACKRGGGHHAVPPLEVVYVIFASGQTPYSQARFEWQPKSGKHAFQSKRARHPAARPRDVLRDGAS